VIRAAEEHTDESFIICGQGGHMSGSALPGDADGAEATPAAGTARFRRSSSLDGEGHYSALARAEARRLRLILCSYGPLHRDLLKRISAPWGREIRFDTALRTGVRSGLLIDLGLNFFEAGADAPAADPLRAERARSG
jgi:hypothetical protein